MSGPQLIMWYENALQQMGLEKNLELEISLIPHAENPDRALTNLRKLLEGFGKR